MLRIDRLLLRENSQGQWKREYRRHKDKTQVQGKDHTWSSLEPRRLLQPHQNQWRNDHDRSGVDHATDGRLANSEGRRLPTLAQALDGLTGFLALLLLHLRENWVHVNSLPDLLASHQEHVEGAGAGDGRKGDQSAENELRVRGDVLEPRDQRIETERHRAGRRHRHHVRLGHLRERQGSGFVCVGAVDRYIERLVADLPEKSPSGLESQKDNNSKETDPSYLEARCQHSRSDDQVGENIAGHAEGKEDRLSGVCERMSINYVGRAHATNLDAGSNRPPS